MTERLTRFIQIVVCVIFIFSALLNVYNYRSFIKRIISKIIPTRAVVIEDEKNVWYTNPKILINHAGVWGGNTNI